MDRDAHPFIGQLDRLITIKKETTTRDADTGEQRPTLVKVMDAWSFMQELSGDETIDGKVRHIIKRSYKIRFDATVAATATKLKIEDQGVLFNVYHVREIGRKQHLELLVNKYD